MGEVEGGEVGLSSVGVAVGVVVEGWDMFGWRWGLNW